MDKPEWDIFGRIEDLEGLAQLQRDLYETQMEGKTYMREWMKLIQKQISGITEMVADVGLWAGIAAAMATTALAQSSPPALVKFMDDLIPRLRKRGYSEQDLKKIEEKMTELRREQAGQSS